MADFNQVGNPLLASGIGRLFGVEFPSIPVVGSEIQIVTSPWERPEFWALAGGSLGWGQIALPAGGAGVWNAVELRNPTGSGCLLICDSILLCNDDGANRMYRFGLRNDPLTDSTGAWGNRDTRRATTTGGSGSLAGRIRTQSPAAESTWNAVFGRVGVITGDTQRIPVDYVMGPGTGFMVQNTAANQSLMVTFFGRERYAPPEELGPL